MLGGEIAIASVPGEGSRLTVSMPFAPTLDPAALAEMAAEIAPSAPTDVTLSGVRVLVADDAADNRGLVGHLLAQAGASVEFALDGREAVERVQATPTAFDVILMDMHMPRLDGYAATTVLRQAGVRIPIVAVTANSMAGERERCLTAGCDAYVTKPIDVDELLAVVERFGRHGASETGEVNGAPKETAAEQAAMT
jgi:two-component system sensor kinase